MRMAMTVITTSSSMSVNAEAAFGRRDWPREILVTPTFASARGRDIARSRSRLANKSLRRSGADPGAAQGSAGIAGGVDRFQKVARHRSRFGDSLGARAAR